MMILSMPAPIDVIRYPALEAMCKAALESARTPEEKAKARVEDFALYSFMHHNGYEKDGGFWRKNGECWPVYSDEYTAFLKELGV